MVFHRIRHARASSPSASSIPSSLATWLCTRRVFFASRFAFAVAAASILGSKVVHVYAHREALAPSDVLAYGLSFFAQDVILLLVLRLLLDAQSSLAMRPLRFLAASLASAIVALSLVLAATSISFFLVAGTELHWRNVGVAGDSSSWAMLLSGLLSCSLTVGSILVAAWLLQDTCFVITNAALAIIQWPFVFLLAKLSKRWSARRNVSYQHVPQDDVEGGASERKMLDDVSCEASDKPAHARPAQSKWFTWLHVAVGASLLTLIVTTLSRPEDNSLVFMSWTLPLMPFVDLINASPSLADLIPSYGTDINGDLGNRTALADPVPFSWLPKDTPLPGFEDWYEKKEHYRAADDPLRISNLDHGVISEIKSKLSDVKIRHVVLIKLESTRKDVFPVKKSGTIWDELIGTFKNKSMPAEALERLATLTPTANMLTGDYDDGFTHPTQPRRGGINANNVHTTSTYTLKSLFGTICGLYPLVADFNVDQANHVYQPCLPHIFNAFNQLDNQDEKPSDDKPKDGDDFTSYNWTSKFMQSVTIGYDKQDAEMPVLGYAAENVVHKEYLQGGKAKFGKVNMSDINYYGMPEVAIKDYIRDAFAEAKKNKERVFLSHLTSTTHHPFGMPEEEKYVPLTAEKKLNDLSHYMNAVGYVDRWLKQILEILDEEGVADETLLVLVGDHGLSLPETGAVTPYYNGNVGNFHVPLVMSHPKLPPVDINDAVVSMQILPTILDLLVETGSLPKGASQAAHDLMHNYEGQSLIRPQRKVSLETGEANWLFTVMNPGRATVAVRDARRPEWRLIMPVIDDVEWRFTDTVQDPRENDAVVAFAFPPFLEKVEKKHGIEAAQWTERAAFMGRWWVKDNGRRWRYNAK
ncbi:sulfatase domain-containing protein [Hirsutella rhossiliensis]|uniref:Sulfatase domain-containing protein n=1 Tax=Hirsutella rhossiliensis TaxID=111463 RepID=A0A9P8SHM4_9HYPO|nr:sulfatase domain-containing protein [Hirsutella rhossiliensis]KAH0961176.1 sulfatase domain-containing protein [Hirsutella rhossiliensis]